MGCDVQVNDAFFDKPELFGHPRPFDQVHFRVEARVKSIESHLISEISQCLDQIQEDDRNEASALHAVGSPLVRSKGSPLARSQGVGPRETGGGAEEGCPDTGLRSPSLLPPFSVQQASVLDCPLEEEGRHNSGGRRPPCERCQRPPRSVVAMKAIYGSYHSMVATPWFNEALRLKSNDQLEDSLECLAHGLSICRRTGLRTYHQLLLRGIITLGEIYACLARREPALRVMKMALDAVSKYVE